LYGALVVKKHIRNPRHRAPALVVARDAARCAPLVIYRAAKAVSRGAARCSSGYALGLGLGGWLLAGVGAAVGAQVVDLASVPLPAKPQVGEQNRYAALLAVA
jgi:hypothetical protein